jgi:hypothetical protein
MKQTPPVVEMFDVVMDDEDGRQTEDRTTTTFQDGWTLD